MPDLGLLAGTLRDTESETEENCLPAAEIPE
jgi:hypothetical protein